MFNSESSKPLAGRLGDTLRAIEAQYAMQTVAANPAVRDECERLQCKILRIEADYALAAIKNPRYATTEEG